MNIDWTYWTAPAIVALASLIYKIISNSKSKQLRSESISNVINNNIIASVPTKDSIIDVEEPKDEFSVKQARTTILFIDDEKFDIVDTLKNAGWINTSLVKRVSNLHDKKIIAADIIFVDINGVGSNLFKDEGLGLARGLKKEYPNKKVILYSGETTGNRFDPTLKIVDDFLEKNAEPFEFISMVERMIK